MEAGSGAERQPSVRACSRVAVVCRGEVKARKEGEERYVCVRWNGKENLK